MSLFITSLNSGSNGNCYYIGNDNEAILIDAGISCRETERRMKRLELDITKVKAIFVSHEHSDHITGVPGISKKFQIPVYITPDTFKNSRIPIEPYLIQSFEANVSVAIGALSVTPFRKFHDAADPHSFIISGDKVNIGVFTDIGHNCKEVIRYFQQCHAVFLEANYCEDMLEKGNYPYHLKQRISSDRGHLSNSQALDLFNKYRAKHLSHLVLSHLSKNNNSPEIVDALFNKHAAATKIIVASRYAETPVMLINATSVLERSSPKKYHPGNQLQLSLF